MYFYLDTDDYKGKEEDIGPTIFDWTNDLVNKTGLSMSKIALPLKEELDSYYENIDNKQSNVSLVEEVVYKYTETLKVVFIVRKKLNELSGSIKKLVIIDPYFFPYSYSKNYIDTIIDILKPLELNIIHVITSKKNTNYDLKNKIQSRLDNSSIELTYSNDFHDRFWIVNDENGFLMGTSLNGLGKKFSIIQKLDVDDVTAIIHEYKRL